ncbi:hypothetical protein [Micromonospora sp. CB01531]|uniref:hypothetical protein n=1 Tax=Micromonospora sp. CB01531 TaxID=1718947 RepID=UPI00093A2201|nr:hypothetical protein [Micromonospora sp. CB01531]OKI63980.1 hypothetical protein A6A27_25990 [Micromonospora sp. CB01531]
MYLPPRSRRLLLAAHIIITVGALGADTALLALAVSGLRDTDPRTVYPAAYLLGRWLVAPLAVSSVLTGLALAAAGPWRPLRHGWVTVKLTLAAVLTAAALALLVPRLGHAAAAAAVASSPPGVPAGDRVVAVAAPAAALLALAINVVLGVFKPGRRRPSQAATSEVAYAADRQR